MYFTRGLLTTREKVWYHYQTKTTFKHKLNQGEHRQLLVPNLIMVTITIISNNTNCKLFYSGPFDSGWLHPTFHIWIERIICKVAPQLIFLFILTCVSRYKLSPFLLSQQSRVLKRKDMSGREKERRRVGEAEKAVKMKIFSLCLFPYRVILCAFLFVSVRFRLQDMKDVMWCGKEAKKYMCMKLVSSTELFRKKSCIMSEHIFKILYLALLIHPRQD